MGFDPQPWIMSSSQVTFSYFFCFMDRIVFHHPWNKPWNKTVLEQLLKLLIMFILFLNHHLLFQDSFDYSRFEVWCGVELETSMTSMNSHLSMLDVYTFGLQQHKPQTHRFHASGGVSGSKSWGDFLIMKSCLVGSKRTLVLKGFFKTLRFCLIFKSISNFSGFQVMNKWISFGNGHHPFADDLMISHIFSHCNRWNLGFSSPAKLPEADGHNLRISLSLSITQ